MLCVCIGLLAMLMAVQLNLKAEGAKVRPLITANILAGLLCVVACIADSTLPLLAAVGSCLLVAMATAVALHGEALLDPRKLLTLARWGPGATFTFAAGLLLLLGAGVGFGVLLAGGGRDEGTATVAISSPYRVSGTCVNGACTVNECKTAAPCGQENEGELREGTPLDIACQTKGEPATAPNGRKSRIWDRLVSGLYVSDLFVEGTATGHFTSSLLQCVET
ncbi:MAG: hypothetical protein ACTHKT_11450 [Solirubrobacterales bacterium]